MKKYLFIIGWLFPFAVASQSISGKVTNKKNEPLIGANVYWLGSAVGVTTDHNGMFEISKVNISSQQLIASYVGHIADTLLVSGKQAVSFSLQAMQHLDEVIIQGESEGVIISSVNSIKTEQITQTELKKAACCDLAGCFETQTTVQPQTTNVITNAKELRILGLSGVYNQVLIDGMPLIQGLSYTYGISSVPGTLVDNVYVAKGANSVLQGYESISGQINVETKDPDKTDRVLLNVYMNSFLEKHFNANYAFKKGKWSNLTALHVVRPANKVDRDQDGFLDLPLLKRYMVFNKWKYGNQNDWGWHSKVGLRFVHEERVGGQVFFNAQTDKGSAVVYGQSVGLNQPEVWTKTGYRFDDKHHIVAFVSTFQQYQNSFFGTVGYQARQASFYSNIQYELSYKNHQIKTGLSYRYLNLQEDILFTDAFLPRAYDGNYQRIENIPGVFVENTMNVLEDKLVWIIGARADHHRQAGVMFAPRTLIKYNATPQTTIRASMGKGWRTVNLFSENIGLLASSRDIVFAEQLQPEEAVNLGLNLIQDIDWGSKNVSGYLSVDYYHIDFHNQIFPDYDADPTKAIIQNFTGESVSHGFQSELYLRFYRRLEWKVGYNYLDVYRRIGEEKQLLPFNSRHKVLTTLGYKPLTNKFHIDVNMHWYGKQRLPNTKSNPIEFQRSDFSAPYTLVNAQFTYNFEMFEVYAGCENIFDFRQRQPIISWENPFSPHFDTSSVWGPTRGRELYLGLRFRLKE